MPKTTNRPTQKRVVPQAPAAAADTADAREPRGARRKRETRARLLDAALKLMAEKGMEGVAINEITEAADVGFGSVITLMSLTSRTRGRTNDMPAADS